MTELAGLEAVASVLREVGVKMWCTAHPKGILMQLADAITEKTVDSHQHRTTTNLPPRRGWGTANDEFRQLSSTVRKLVESIALVARSNTPVLILGESCSVIERVARAIHAGGPRAGQPFVSINTSAIPEQLLESELFGHVRGAFTGATQARRGLLMDAHGGTLLLDEVGDLPLTLQTRLLRALRFGETRQVGSDRMDKVDVRLIATTERDLSVLVSQGRFREDLRYRLNAIPLLVPPLRNRREDILPIVARFLQETQVQTQESPATLKQANQRSRHFVPTRTHGVKQRTPKSI